MALPAEDRTPRAVMARILPRRETSAFGSIEIYPPGIRFETQNPGERVFILVRAHVFTNIGWIIRVSFLLVLPFLISIGYNALDMNITFIPGDVLVVVLMAYYLSVLSSALMNILKWYYNIYLVTSERILHFSFKPLSTYKISEAEIENIQDVSQSSVGLLPNVLGYGDILVQTASKQNKFLFRSVPRPVWFRDVITDLSRLTRTNEP